MVNKGIVGAAGGGIAIAIAGVIIFASGLFPGTGQMQPPTGGNGGMVAPGKQDVILSLTSLDITEKKEESVTIDIVFDVFNPNRNTLVLETIEYDLIADGIKLTSSTIGERLQGVVTGTGQTYYLVSNLTLTLKDTIELRRAGIFAPVWNSLQTDDVDWRIKGKYIITDPVRLGGQEKDFDFTL